jgi:hypothetical protein
VLATSCIAKEPENAECDIISAALPGDVLNREPVIENDKVVFIVKNGTDVTHLAPTFQLTPGATIVPESGTERDFSEPQKYVVTSEDKEWHKTYTVEVQENNTINLAYDFENVRLYTASSYSYDIFYEVGENGAEVMTWASGNPGFALTGQGSTPETFPTYQVYDGLNGKCVALTTRSTGSFGALAKKPLAAGSIFIGRFDVKNAMTKPLESTQFGTPFYNLPRRLTGYYKYAPGETYYKPNSSGKLEAVPGQTDKFNIYAVFFEATDDMEMLNGTNVLSEDNPNIVAVAQIDDANRVPANDWTEFNIPFVYRDTSKIDISKLLAGKYSITIVFTSSLDGDYFSGAIGSTLMIDEATLKCVGPEDFK